MTRAQIQGNVDVERGGLLGFAADTVASTRRSAAYVDKILKRAKPAELPIEQPMNFEFAINLQIGVSIPPDVLLQATQVIE